MRVANVTSPRARRRLTLVAMTLGLSLTVIDATVIGVALPSIADGLGANLTDQQWMVDGYLLALAGLLLVGGALGDRLGRRRVYIVGLAAFVVTSLLCGLAQSPGQLIAARILQGIAGALLIPGTLAILTATFSGAALGRAIGSWAAWSALAGALAPIVGGAAVDWLSWRWAFLVNLPVGAATIILTVIGVDDSRARDVDGHLDWLGAALACVMLAALTFGLIEGPVLGWAKPATWGALALAGASFAAFVGVEIRVARPLIPLRWFLSGNFAAANAATLGVYAALSGVFFLLPLVLQGVQGYSALASGAALLPVTILLLAISSRMGPLNTRYGPRWFMAGGPILFGVGALLLTRISASADYIGTLLPALLLCGVGLAITVAPLTSTVMSSVDADAAGVASAVNNAMSRLAGLVGIAIVGGLLTVGVGRSLDRAARATDTPSVTTAFTEARQRPLALPEVRTPDAAERVRVERAITSASVSGSRGAFLGMGLLAILGGGISALFIRNPRPQDGISPVG